MSKAWMCANNYGTIEIVFADTKRRAKSYLRNFTDSFEDYRCALSGAWQMYSALQIKGVPTRMCLFRNSCHELSRSGKPKSRIRRLEEIGAWVDRFLR